MGFTAYLVGGGVRDLLLGRPSKDFDIGTWRSHTESSAPSATVGSSAAGSAWRTSNSGPKRSKSPRSAAMYAPTPSRSDGQLRDRAADADVAADGPRRRRSPDPARQRLRDARKKTLSAAISPSTRSSTTPPTRPSSITSAAWRICKARVIRSIGDPMERFQEDPVRMLRALVLGERLGFNARRRGRARDRGVGSQIRLSAPARLMEEYTRSCAAAPPNGLFGAGARRPDRAHQPGNGRRALGGILRIARAARLVSSAVRGNARHADDDRSRRLAARAARPDGQASRRFGVSEQWYPALGRLPVPRKDVERLGSCWPCCRRCATSSRRRARITRWCTRASSATRSRGSKSTATTPASSALEGGAPAAGDSPPRRECRGPGQRAKAPTRSEGGGAAADDEARSPRPPSPGVSLALIVVVSAFRRTPGSG